MMMIIMILKIIIKISFAVMIMMIKAAMVHQGLIIIMIMIIMIMIIRIMMIMIIMIMMIEAARERVGG